MTPLDHDVPARPLAPGESVRTRPGLGAVIRHVGAAGTFRHDDESLNVGPSTNSAGLAAFAVTTAE
jgi:hypothetical protein